MMNKFKLSVLSLAFMSTLTMNAGDNVKGGVDKANLDLTVAPGEDFYQYATGGWQKNNPLDPQYARYGTFDDCQALVKNAFADAELNSRMMLTSANSINVARFLPQMFYYFYAYAQLARMGENLDNVVVSVPSGNFGNLTAGLIAKAMGLPIKRFIAANNRNDVVYKYLQTGKFEPKPSVATIANAMDVGNPSNFARILDLYHNDWEAIKAEISGFTYTDEQIAATLAEVYRTEGYLLDPHGAVAYRSLLEGLQPDEVGVMLETAHPAKFKSVVDNIIGEDIDIPQRLAAFMENPKQSVRMPSAFGPFKQYLLSKV